MENDVSRKPKDPEVINPNDDKAAPTDKGCC